VSATDLIVLGPLIVIGAAAVAVMLQAAFCRHHLAAAASTSLAFTLGLASLLPVSIAAPRQVTPLLILDYYALLYMGLILAACLAVALLSYDYLAVREGEREEFYALLLLATLGAMVLVAGTHFASLFLGLELLSVSLYALIAYQRTEGRPLEAGLKYLILAAASSAFLLFGMALIYAQTGTMAFGRMASWAHVGGGASDLYLKTGLALMIAGIGFKLAVVPFHMWTPDVYEGAPAPVTAFVATVSKGAMFALLLRYLVRPEAAHSYTLLIPLFSLIAIASMFAGNLLALMQNNIKRILAYSSIAHLGYLLVAFLAAGSMAVEAATFYLVTYFVATLGAFGIVAIMSGREREADAMDDYRGLFWRRPGIASAFTAMLLSLAGIPLTAGFIGKFFIVTAGIGSALWALVLILVINSAISLFYYLRIVAAMFSEPTAQGVETTQEQLSTSPSAGALVLVVLMLLLIWLGILPGFVLSLIRSATEGVL